MTTEAAIGYGSSLERSSDGTSSGVFSSVGEVLSISLPSLSKDTVDATHMESADAFREYIPGLKDGGEVSVEVNLVPGSATTTAALADFASDVVGYYKIIFPDDTEWAFAAICTGFEGEAPLDDKMTATFTYKVTGKPAFIS